MKLNDPNSPETMIGQSEVGGNDWGFTHSAVDMVGKKYPLSLCMAGDWNWRGGKKGRSGDWGLQVSNWEAIRPLEIEVTKAPMTGERVGSLPRKFYRWYAEVELTHTLYDKIGLRYKVWGEKNPEAPGVRPAVIEWCMETGSWLGGVSYA